MSKNAFPVRRLVIDAVLTALFYVLSLFSLTFGHSLKLTLDSLPCILAAVLYGPVDGFLVAFLGTFAQQMMQYGFTVTTLLWMLAPALRGLILGLLMKLFPDGIREPGQYVRYFLFCVLAGIFVSAGNTAVLYLDSKLFGYYNYALVFGAAVVRFVSGIAASLLTAAAIIPVCLALFGAGLVRRPVFR